MTESKGRQPSLRDRVSRGVSIGLSFGAGMAEIAAPGVRRLLKGEGHPPTTREIIVASTRALVLTAATTALYQLEKRVLAKPSNPEPTA